MKQTEKIGCPLCDSMAFRTWAEENGYAAVKCEECGLIYVNPRPVEELIREGVETGVHREIDADRDSIGRRSQAKVGMYSKILGSMFANVFSKGAPVRWIDVGAGY